MSIAARSSEGLLLLELFCQRLAALLFIVLLNTLEAHAFEFRCPEVGGFVMRWGRLYFSFAKSTSCAMGYLLFPC